MNASVRISEKNRINTRIRDVESYIRFNANAIQRMRGSSGNMEFNRTKTAQMKSQNEDFSAEVKELNDRLAKLGAGDLDKELKAARRNDTLVERKKTQEKRKKKSRRSGSQEGAACRVERLLGPDDQGFQESAVQRQIFKERIQLRASRATIPSSVHAR